MQSNRNLQQWFGCFALIIVMTVALFIVCVVFLDGDSKCRDAADKADYGMTIEERREGVEYFGKNCTFGEYGQPIAK